MQNKVHFGYFYFFSSIFFGDMDSWWTINFKLAARMENTATVSVWCLGRTIYAVGRCFSTAKPNLYGPKTFENCIRHALPRRNGLGSGLDPVWIQTGSRNSNRWKSYLDVFQSINQARVFSKLSKNISTTLSPGGKGSRTQLGPKGSE